MALENNIYPPTEDLQGKFSAFLYSVGPEYTDEGAATIERRREAFKHAWNNTSDKVSVLTEHLFGLRGHTDVLIKLATKRGRDQHLGLASVSRNFAATAIMRYSPPKIRTVVMLGYVAARPTYMLVRQGPQVLGEAKEVKAALSELGLATLGRLGFFTIAKKEMKLLQGTPA